METIANNEYVLGSSYTSCDIRNTKNDRWWRTFSDKLRLFGWDGSVCHDGCYDFATDRYKLYEHSYDLCSMLYCAYDYWTTGNKE